MVIKQPNDKSQFILPDLGEGVHEAELIKWRVSPGDHVDEHQTLAEMETDKALVEVPSPWPGVIRELHGKEGDIIIVGTALVSYTVGQAAAGGSAAITQQSAAGGAETSATAVAATATSSADADAGTVVGSVDSAMKIPAALTRTRSAAPAINDRAKALATPAVRRIAREQDIDINIVPGTGRGGRVTATDLEGFLGTAAPPTAPRPRTGPHEEPRGHPAPELTPGPPAISPDGVAERIPIRGLRRKIAESLTLSVRTAVHFTVVDEADVTRLDARRQEFGRMLGYKISMLPFVMTAVVRALRHHPALNANVDDPNNEIVVMSTINLGCAVDTEHGLMVPVINDADRLSIVQLSEAVAAVAKACRNRTIDRGRLIGGTFTISNVGSYGGMFATPIINYPEVAILAIGRTKEQVLTKDGMFYAGKVLPLSLSCDHRVVDGAEGARFLHHIVTFLEDPEALLA